MTQLKSWYLNKNLWTFLSYQQRRMSSEFILLWYYCIRYVEKLYHTNFNSSNINSTTIYSIYHFFSKIIEPPDKQVIWSVSHTDSAWCQLCCVPCLVAQSCPTLCDCSQPGFSVHGDFPDKNTGVGCHALLQGIFPTQGSNLVLPHCRWILYWLSHQGSPRLLE